MGGCTEVISTPSKTETLSASTLQTTVVLQTVTVKENISSSRGQILSMLA